MRKRCIKQLWGCSCQTKYPWHDVRHILKGFSRIKLWISEVSAVSMEKETPGHLLSHCYISTRLTGTTCTCSKDTHVHISLLYKHTLYFQRYLLSQIMQQPVCQASSCFAKLAFSSPSGTWLSIWQWLSNRHEVEGHRDPFICWAWKVSLHCSGGVVILKHTPSIRDTIC